MSDAVVNSLMTKITAAINLQYKYSCEEIIFLGWKIVDTNDMSNPNFNLLKSIKDNSTIDYNKITAKNTLKALKSHINEAKLVKLLEEKGIGRPSTFSSLVDKIQERGYVKKDNEKGKKMKCIDFELVENEIEEIETEKEFGNEQNKLIIQPIGSMVIEFLMSNFEEIVGYDYTKNMEDDLDKISKETDCDLNEIEEVLFKLQKLEPAGVFARNLSECLNIQLNEKSLLSDGLDILLDNLDLLAKGEIKQLMKITNFEQDEISKSITLIRSLNPKPGESYSFDETIQNSPDVIVSKGRKGWVVELNKSTLPAEVIDENYISELSSKKHDDNSSTYISDTIASARWLKRSVEQRNSTTLTIASAIIAQQEEFLEKGLSHLKPMVLRDIASNVGMHESTVSRVTTGLTIETPRGCFAMKYFFSVSLNSADNNETHAATAVRETIKKLISEEPSKKPLSDEAIATIMKKDGIDLARRTVAKYREIMKIPSSAQRKRQSRLAEIS